MTAGGRGLKEDGVVADFGIFNSVTFRRKGTVNPDTRMPADATSRPTMRAGSDVDGPIVLTVRRGVGNEGI